MTTAATYSIWVHGWPVRESEMTTRAGKETLSALRWKNEVAWQVHRVFFPWQPLAGYIYRGQRVRAVQVAYRFQGVAGDTNQYVKATRQAISTALLSKERQVTTLNVTSKPGEPGVWLEISEVK